MMLINKQEWHNISDSDLIRYVILDERGASAILEIYNKPSEDGYGCRAFLYGLWVDNQLRHRGIGQELLDKCIDITICNGIDALFLEYEKVNHPWILQWYKRNGFMVLAKNKNKCLMKKTNSSKMKTLNKWLNKLFGIKLVNSADLDSLRYEIQFLRNKINSLLLGKYSSCVVEFHQRNAEYRVYLIRDFYYIPVAKFPFAPDDANSRKYAKVCAEDLADALRDAEQYEPIK